MMRSLLLALPFSLLVPAAAHALSTSRGYDLSIEGTPVGTMSFRNGGICRMKVKIGKSPFSSEVFAR